MAGTDTRQAPGAGAESSGQGGWRRFWRWAALAVRVALGLVFIYAGAGKLLAPADFAAVIREYGLAPGWAVAPLALGLPALEVVSGAALILGFSWALPVVAAQLFLFAFVLWFGVLSGLDIDCGCFSKSELAEHASLAQALRRDLVFLAGAIFLFVSGRLVRLPRWRPAVWESVKKKG